MADSELKLYPRGQLSFGPGDMAQVTSVRMSFTNSGKLKHTLKKSPSGKVLGNKEVSGSFDMEIDEDGPEREVFDRIRTGSDVNLRLKIPKVTKNIVVFLTSVDLDIPLDDAVKFTVNYLGKMSS